MTTGQYRIERLDRSHNRGAFSSGSDPLDVFLKQFARQNAEGGLGAVFVLVDTSVHRIVGYYTLSSYLLQWNELPEDVTRRLPRYPVPAVLMGRLAVDSDYQGQGFGRHLLVDGLKKAYAHSRDVGALAVVVDAKDDAAKAFYLRYGFHELVDQPYKLFITMRTIAMIP